MLKTIRRRLCSHTFSWSERRHGDVCVKCGQFRPEAETSGRTRPARLGT